MPYVDIDSSELSVHDLSAVADWTADTGAGVSPYSAHCTVMVHPLGSRSLSAIRTTAARSEFIVTRPMPLKLSECVAGLRRRLA